MSSNNKKETSVYCPKCHRGKLLKRSYKNKVLYMCSNFSECDYTCTVEPKYICSRCGGVMLLKNGKFGKFYGCSNFPECKNSFSAYDKNSIDKEKQKKFIKPSNKLSTSTHNSSNTSENNSKHKYLTNSFSNLQIPADKLDILFEDYNLSTRLMNVLNSLNIFKVKDILNYSYEQVLKFPNMGKKTAKELKDFLNNLPNANKDVVIWKTFEEFAKSQFQGKNLDIILDRFNGKTLENIAQKYNLSRQRILQICNKLEWNRTIRLEIDKYKDIFTRYKWKNPDIFCEIFEEDKTCYYYLNFRYGYGELPLEQLFNESTLTNVQRNILAAYFSNVLSKDNEIIFRKDVFEKIIKKYALNKISFKEFTAKYNMEIDKYPEFKFRKVTPHVMQARLRQRDDILWCGDYSFRYYDFENIKQSKLEQLLPTFDGFFSSMYVFKENKELMNEWDIRDKNELHNILKKCIHKENVFFSRMPHFYINKKNKNSFLIEQAKKYSPISIDELTKILYDSYGLDEGTMKSSLFSVLSPYIVENNVIDMQTELLSCEEKEHLQKNLTEDIYTIKELNDILFSLGYLPNKVLKRHNCLQIGYMLYADFLISTRFGSVVNYLNYIVETKEIISANDNIYKLPTIYQQMLNLQKEMKIFKITADFWITVKKLESIGISKINIKSFIDEVIFLFKNKDFFSIYNVLNEIDYSIFERKGLSEVFLENILMSIPQINILKISHNILFSFTFKSITINSFVRYLIEQFGRITLLDLSKEITQRYQLKISIEKLRKIVITFDDIFYSDILEKIYLDKNEYYEEVYYEK